MYTKTLHVHPSKTEDDMKLNKFTSLEAWTSKFITFVNAL